MRRCRANLFKSKAKSEPRTKRDAESGAAFIEYVAIMIVMVIGMIAMRSVLLNSIQTRDTTLSQSVSSNYPNPLKISP